jgi:hypothetical protein
MRGEITRSIDLEHTFWLDQEGRVCAPDHLYESQIDKCCPEHKYKHACDCAEGLIENMLADMDDVGCSLGRSCYGCLKVRGWRTLWASARKSAR